VTRPQAARGCLAAALEEGLLRASPAAGIRVVEHVDDDADERARAVSRDELAAFLLACPTRWSLFFRVLAATGLRIAEAIVLQTPRTGQPDLTRLTAAGTRAKPNLHAACLRRRRRLDEDALGHLESELARRRTL
jgi:integrase